jgi:hypothetical protein
LRVLLARFRLGRGLRHRIDLGLRKISEFSRLQASELEWTHAHAHEARHFEPDGLRHATHLALPSGEQHHRDPRAAPRARTHRDAHSARHALFERDPVLEAGDRLVGEIALHGDVVLALVTVARMEHALRPCPVVRE